MGPYQQEGIIVAYPIYECIYLIYYLIYQSIYIPMSDGVYESLSVLP